MSKNRVIIFSLSLMTSLGVGASLNYGYAQYAIGTMYADEFENWDNAKKWWREGAEKGNPFAQVMLGSYYALLGDGFDDPNYFLNIDGTEDDNKIGESYAEAMKWYRLAADQGNANAQHNIGLMYGNGYGVLQDNVRAHLWYNIASANGYEEAGEWRDKTAFKMPPADISEAQSTARACMSSNYKNCGW